MTNFNPDIIHNDFRDGKIDKDTAAHHLITFIKNKEDSRYRIDAINILGEIGATNKEVFELLENIIVSTNLSITTAPATKILVNNFPKKCVKPLLWAVQNDEIFERSTVIFDYVWWNDNPAFDILKEELFKKFEEFIREKEDEGLFHEEAIVMALLQRFSHKIHRVNFDQDTENLSWGDLRYYYKVNQDGYIIELFFSPHGISYMPENIYRLKYLEQFTSMDGELQRLPETIGNLKKLKKLNLMANQLTILPESIGDLENLEEFNLAYNYLQSLPNSIGNLKNLRILNLEDNNIKKLPLSIKNLESLEELYLSGNNIEIFPDAILNLKNLKNLSLGGNRIKFIPDSINRLKKLKKLGLTQNELNNLPSTITDLKDLENLSLSGNNFEVVPEFLENLKNLESLELGINKLKTLPD